MLLLVVHRDRRQLAVPQVAREIGLVHAAGDGLLVAAAGEDPLALLRLDDRRPGVLAHRQHATGRDRRVLQQVEGDEPVVVARLRIVEDRPQLAEVRRAEEVGDVVHRLGGEPCQRARLDLEERALAGFERRDPVARHEAVGRRVRPERHQLGEGELGHGRDHTARRRPTPHGAGAVRKRGEYSPVRMPSNVLRDSPSTSDPLVARHGTIDAK